MPNIHLELSLEEARDVVYALNVATNEAQQRGCTLTVSEFKRISARLWKAIQQAKREEQEASEA